MVRKFYALSLVGMLGLFSFAAEKIKVTEWAKDKRIAGPVGIDVDANGRVFVTRTTRRKQSSLDLRHRKVDVKKDLSLQTIEERREFYKETFTKEANLKWIPDRNKDGSHDWRDLTVQEDDAYVIVDKDGDGKGESYQKIDSYHTEVTGIAGDILALGNRVFVAAEPSIYMYTDIDGDDKYETSEEVVTGFSVHVGQGGHNMSGLALGPDGRIYWAVADKGFSVVTKEGKKYHRPNSGGVFRCELDGSDVELFATGVRNAQELAFDKYGNLFSMDNDGDYKGEMERSLYITEGSEHGWRLNWQWMKMQDFMKISGLTYYNPWMAEKLYLPDHETHASYMTPTIGNFGPGPCGFTANPGTALSESFEDCFFMTNNKAEIRVFKFLQNGASFKFEEQDKMSGGSNNTGLAIGADGALYTSAWHGANGAVFRFDVEKNKHKLRKETAKILAASFSKESSSSLINLLGHVDQRVRTKAQFELVAREKEGASVFSKALSSSDQLTKLHALWGIGQLARKDSSYSQLLAKAFADKDVEVLGLVAKLAGELKAERFSKELLAGLNHENVRVQFFSAIALGNCKIKESADALITFAAEKSSDPYLHHAAIMGFSGAMTPTQLAALSTHANREVRLAAIVALRKLESPAVKAFLNDSDELVLLEAARAIHDDASIPAAMQNLYSLLNRPELKNEALMRRAINAAFRTGSQDSLQFLTQYVKSGKASENLRRTALASILWWAKPPVLCAVEGRYRKLAERNVEPVFAAVNQLKETIAQDRALTEVLLNGVDIHGHAQWLKGMEFNFVKQSLSVQDKLLVAMGKINSPELKKYVQLGLNSKDSMVRYTAQGLAQKAGIDVFDIVVSILDDPKGNGHGKALEQLMDMKSPKAKAKFDELLAQFKAGKIPAKWSLDMQIAAKAKGHDSEVTTAMLANGGDAIIGKKIVMEHPASQCIRCHKIGKSGSDLGPDLSKIGSKSAEYLVDALLKPNKDIAPGYGNVFIKTKAGKDIAGVLLEKGKKEWSIKAANGSKQSIKVNDIASHQLTSVMPPMGMILKPKEIRDTVQYLKSLVLTKKRKKKK
ncbi:MAG: c-type cytochrome [Lentisphaerales bacterium]|nr:c-type cytochrome [Lentisphaerales bacterium]